MVRILTVLLSALVLGMALSAPAFATKSFAIYNPGTSVDGVWDDEVTAIKAILKDYGWSYSSIGPDQINSGQLTNSDGSLKYKALIAPGGYAYIRETQVSLIGERHLRDYVNAGGGYVGFCAGAYWAGDTVSFAQTPTGGGGSYNLASDYQDYDYHLALFNGTSQGPFGWYPWSGGESANTNYQLADINNNSKTMDKIDMPGKTRFVYGGGPFFVFAGNKPSNYESWAKVVMPSNANSNGSTGKNQPSIIHHTLGKGHVVLFAYHPTILVKSNVDNVKIGGESSTSWDRGSQSYKEINTYSWNILHAALQTVSGKKVTEVTSLPSS